MGKICIPSWRIQLRFSVILLSSSSLSLLFTPLQLNLQCPYLPPSSHSRKNSAKPRDPTQQLTGQPNNYFRPTVQPIAQQANPTQPITHWAHLLFIKGPNPRPTRPTYNGPNRPAQQLNQPTYYLPPAEEPRRTILPFDRCPPRHQGHGGRSRRRRRGSVTEAEEEETMAAERERRRSREKKQGPSSLPERKKKGSGRSAPRSEKEEKDVGVDPQWKEGRSANGNLEFVAAAMRRWCDGEGGDEEREGRAGRRWRRRWPRQRRQ